MKNMVLIVTFLILLVGGNKSSLAQEQQKTLTLSQSLEQAMSHNEDLMLVREDLKKADKQIQESWSQALPQITLSAGYTSNWLLPSTVFDTPEGRQTVTIGTRYNATGSINLRQPIYSGGKTKAALRGAKAFKQLSVAHLKMAERQVKTQVETAFYDFLLAKDLVRVSLVAIEQAKANLDQTKTMRRVGRVSDYEVLRANVQVAELRPDSLRAQNNLELAENTFKNVVGIRSEVRVTLVGSFRTDSFLSQMDHNELVVLGTEHRSEMHQQQSQIEMQAQNIDIEKAGARPTIDITANGQVQMQSNAFGLQTDEARESWTTGVSLSFPLFDGRRTSARVAQAKIDLKRAEIEQSQLIRRIQLEIRQARLDVEEAQKRVAAQEGVVSQAKRGAEIVASRFAKGLGTQLEVLDAQVVMTRAQIAYAQALRDRAVAFVRLEQAVGLSDKSEIHTGRQE